MEEIIFKIQGSAPEPYEVIFRLLSKEIIIASCTCEAGRKRQNCKHRMQIINGNASNILSNNKDKLKTIASWLVGTELKKVVDEVVSLETKRNEIDSQLKATKKNLTKLIYNESNGRK